MPRPEKINHGFARKSVLVGMVVVMAIMGVTNILFQVHWEKQKQSAINDLLLQLHDCEHSIGQCRTELDGLQGENRELRDFKVRVAAYLAESADRVEHYLDADEPLEAALDLYESAWSIQKLKLSGGTTAERFAEAASLILKHERDKHEPVATPALEQSERPDPRGRGQR